MGLRDDVRQLPLRKRQPRSLWLRIGEGGDRGNLLAWREEAGSEKCRGRSNRGCRGTGMIAVIALLLALQVAPELKQHVEAGLKAKRAGDLDTAIHEFKKVVELAPGLAASHINLGAVYFEKKDFGAAIPPLRKALELNPDLPGAHSMLGAALLAQGYASESIPNLEKAKATELLGVALLEAGRAREALDKLEEALEKQPDNPDLL